MTASAGIMRMGGVHSSNLLVEALDRSGSYDAVKLAGVLDWTQRDVASYLGKDPSAITRAPASPQFQERLGELASLVVELKKMLDDNMAYVRAWMNTPVRALDGSTPKKLILGGEIKRVVDLIGECRSGFAL